MSVVVTNEMIDAYKLARGEDDMPERIWAGDFDAQGFGHCVAGMQGGLYSEYVRADLAHPPTDAGVSDDMVKRFFAELRKRNAPMPFTEDAKSALRAALSTATPAGDGVPPCREDRWPRKGDTMRFLNRNGYDFEREAAAKVMTEGQTFTVKQCRVGEFSHSVQFEEITGTWNGVMFAMLSTASTAVKG